MNWSIAVPIHTFLAPLPKAGGSIPLPRHRGAGRRATLRFGRRGDRRAPRRGLRGGGAAADGH